jgi:hypothetical protein
MVVVMGVGAAMVVGARAEMGVVVMVEMGVILALHPSAPGGKRLAMPF